jgi:hypothetical protein
MRRYVLIAFLVAAATTSAAAAADPTDTVRLRPLAHSTVGGTAILAARGAGTSIVLRLHGLAPGASVRWLLHAGTCRRPSASVAIVGTGTADRVGRLARAGSVRFRGEPLRMAIVADGDHLLTIVENGRVVACGAIPRVR